MAKYLAFLFALALIVLPWEASSHRSVCHRWHSCPSDSGTYICGDQGYCSQCPDSQYCLDREPRRVSEQDRGGKTQSSRDLSALTFDEILELIQPMTPLQVKTYLQSLKGKKLQGLGLVEDVIRSYNPGKRRYEGYNVLINLGPPDYSLSKWDVEVNVPESAALKLNEDQPVKFAGTIESIWINPLSKGSLRLTLEDGSAMVTETSRLQPASVRPKAPEAKKRRPELTRVVRIGTYEVRSPTFVYSEPREDSRKITRIEEGTKVNVVGVRGDWLEIRSKHGRPPGFIRKDSVVPIGSR